LERPKALGTQRFILKLKPNIKRGTGMNFKFTAIAFLIATTGASAAQAVDDPATLEHNRAQIVETTCGENPTDECRAKIASLPDSVISDYHASMSASDETPIKGKSPTQAGKKSSLQHDRDEILKTTCGDSPTEDCRKTVASLPNRQVHDYYLYDVYTRLWHNSNDLLDDAAKNGASTNEMQSLAHDSVKYELLSRKQARILGLRDDD
jgi:hypothetical protein